MDFCFSCSCVTVGLQRLIMNVLCTRVGAVVFLDIKFIYIIIGLVARQQLQ